MQFDELLISSQSTKQVAHAIWRDFPINDIGHETASLIFICIDLHT